MLRSPLYCLIFKILAYVPHILPSFSLQPEKVFFQVLLTNKLFFQSNPLRFKRKKKYCELITKWQITATLVKMQNRANISLVSSFTLPKPFEFMDSSFSAGGSHLLSRRTKYIGFNSKIILWMGHRPLCWHVNCADTCR